MNISIRAQVINELVKSKVILSAGDIYHRMAAQGYTFRGLSSPAKAKQSIRVALWKAHNAKQILRPMAGFYRSTGL
jgi:hypothetical protein